MIKFVDFPGIKEGKFLISRDENQAMLDMNKWIEDNEIEIISVETIMEGDSVVFDCFRLWYKNVEV